MVQKHKLLQILVNLIRNANQACDEVSSGDGQLVISLEDCAYIRISVADNGVGIASEHLPRIFGYGFTTKKDGHGFGLQCALLAARRMGGDLRVHSEGVGKGAVFTLDLPFNAALPNKTLIHETLPMAA